MPSEILNHEVVEKNARIANLQRQLEAAKSSARNQVMDA